MAMATWKLRLWKAWSILLVVTTTQGVVWTAKMPRVAHGGNHSSSVAEVDYSVLPQSEKQKVFWMHCPKTGEFASTMISVLCSRAEISLDQPFLRINKFFQDNPKEVCDVSFLNPEESLGFHFPYQPSYKGAAVTLVRDPVDRLVSAFFFKKPCGHLPRGMRERPRDWCLQKDSGGPSAANNITKRMHLYLAQPGIKHCQTKMVMGDGSSPQPNVLRHSSMRKKDTAHRRSLDAQWEAEATPKKEIPISRVTEDRDRGPPSPPERLSVRRDPDQPRGRQLHQNLRRHDLCGSDDSWITEEIGAEARRRLREDFLFVGLSNYFEHSIRLFHAQFEPTYGSHPITSYELAHVRGSTTSEHDKEEARAAIASFGDGGVDNLVHYDRLLYEEAQRIFWSKYNAHFDDGLQL